MSKVRNRGKARVTDVVLYAFTLALVLWAVIPFFWTLSTSLKSLGEIYKIPPTIIPNDWTLENYGRIFERLTFVRYFFNSIFVTLVTIAITVVLSVLAAYAFSRFRFPFRHVILLAVLVPRIIPSVTRIIPLYQIFSDIGFMNTLSSLIGPYVADALPISVWILIGFFDGIPRDLEEAAKVDGCTRLGALFRVVVPLTAPGVMTVSLFTFLRAWNEFIVAFTFIRSGDLMTLPVAHYRVFEFFGIRHWGAINAFTVLAVIPVVIFFLLFQKHIVKSLVSGSVKG